MRRKKIFLICLVIMVGVLIINPVESGYFFIRGLIAFTHGFNGESVRYLERAVITNPNFLESYLFLALAYAEWGSSSLHYMEYDDGGRAKLKSETLDRAEEVLNTALRKFPYHYARDRIQYMLGKIYDQDPRNSGYIWDKSKATNYYALLISEHPSSNYVEKAKKRIEALSR